MSEYRVRATGEVKSQSQIRLDNKNMSLPRVWTANVCDALGVDPVLAAPAPEPSAAYKSVVRNGAVQDADGNWVEAWVEREMFTEYTDENGDVQTVAAQKTAYDTENTAVRAAAERAKRTALLMETDHYALADVTMTDAMKTYRQALRDVPQQTDFPDTINWPTKP
jgi:hypothetical protein